MVWDKKPIVAGNQTQDLGWQCSDRSAMTTRQPPAPHIKSSTYTAKVASVLHLAATQYVLSEFH